jgi:hypothetical protein
MKPEQLPPETKSKLDELLQGIEQALKSNKSPHLHAVSGSWSEDVSVALNGGGLRAPAKPPFNFDKKRLTTLHKSLLGSGGGVLFGVVVHGERPSLEGQWELKTKLISKADHQQLLEARKPVDTEVERELRRLTDKAKWEYVSYGFEVKGNPPELIRNAGGEVERLEARPELVSLLPRAQAVYREAGLDLVTALWTLRRPGLEFMGYWE